MLMFCMLKTTKKKTCDCRSFATGQNRTDDIRIFSPALYQLSYSGECEFILSKIKKTVNTNEKFFLFFCNRLVIFFNCVIISF